MRILIVAEHIAPVSAVGAIRWTKLGKYFSRRGHEVDVLTCEKNYQGEKNSLQYEYDELLAADMDEFNDIHEIRDSRLLKFAYGFYNHMLDIFAPGLRKKPVNSKQQSEPKVSPLVQHGYWVFENLRALELIRNAHLKHFLSQREGYDLLVSSFGPLWTHIMAKRIKRISPQTLWIADYRDAVNNGVVYSGSGPRAFAEKVTGAAEVIMAVSQGVIDQLSLTKNHRTWIYPNGYDFSLDGLSDKDPIKTDTFNIVYTGLLYNQGDAKRDARPLLVAIKDLVDEGAIDPAKVKFVYAGRSSNILREQFESVASGIQLEDHGLVSHAEALALQEQSSALLVLSWNLPNYQGVLTGKVFEYLQAKRPIIALISGSLAGSALKKLIEETESGFVYEEATADADTAQLKEYILRLYQEWLSSGITSSHSDNNEICKYSYERIAGQLDERIAALL